MGITMGTGGASGCSATVTSPKKNMFCLARSSAVWFSIICSGLDLNCRGGRRTPEEVEGGGVGVAGIRGGGTLAGGVFCS